MLWCLVLFVLLLLLLARLLLVVADIVCFIETTKTQKQNNVVVVVGMVSLYVVIFCVFGVCYLLLGVCDWGCVICGRVVLFVF